jgi:hypothetical protein
MPAAIVRLNEAWEDSRQKLIVGMLPAMTRATNWLAEELPGAVDTALTALSAFDTDPRSNALSRWLHRSFAGRLTGGAFDYALTHGVKDMTGDLGLNQSGLDALGLSGSPKAPGRFVKGGVGGTTWDDPLPPKGLANPLAQPPVKVKWDVGDPLANRPINLVTKDNKVIASVVMRGAQKAAHQQGRGSGHG